MAFPLTVKPVGAAKFPPKLLPVSVDPVVEARDGVSADSDPGSGCVEVAVQLRSGCAGGSVAGKGVAGHRRRPVPPPM